MERVILHSDMNNFYASVECLYQPWIRNKPVAVCGDAQARHGIVLAKNNIAKRYHIQTGEAIWEAKQKCGDLVVVPPNYEKYIHFSNVAREIYAEYSDRVESFGLDECWLDCTESTGLFGDGKAIADKIRRRIKYELGVTNSVGVSFNKVFAKLGSDMKKPDATTVISQSDFRQKVWPLPVKELLYVGKATSAKLNRYGIQTIGDLAHYDVKYLKSWLGKWGVVLWRFANGLDNSPVQHLEARPLIKSIGNSITCIRDLTCDTDVKIVVYVLAESVAERLRMNHIHCQTVQVSIRDHTLQSFERQGALGECTNLSSVIAQKAFSLFTRNYSWEKSGPIRSIGVRACKLSLQEEAKQISFLPEQVKRQKQELVEQTVDEIRSRFGHYAIGRGIMLSDPNLSHFSPKDDHVIFPVSYFK